MARKSAPFVLRPSRLIQVLSVAVLAGSFAGTPAMAADQASIGSARQLDGSYWQNAAKPTGKSATAASAALANWRALTLDRATVSSVAALAPMEFTSAARVSPAIISLPHPDGSFQRFTLVESPVMESELAAKHPEIKTYAGRGIDDPTASLRMDITPMGLHASVRSSHGAWYVEPQQKLDQSLYASYRRGDRVPDTSGLREPALDTPEISLVKSRLHSGETMEVHGAGYAAGASVKVTLRDASGGEVDARTVTADAEGVIAASFTGTRVAGDYVVEASIVTLAAGKTSRGAAPAARETEAPLSMPVRVLSGQEPDAASVGNQLRTYRLALLTDPSYATFSGGPANVTAAKVTLINRVTQVYEDETSIRMVLINGNDALNIDTDAQMTGTNSICGGAACYTTSQAGSCASSTLTRNRQVIGLLVGARNFDIGHIALGKNGGGVASLGVVGGTNKAQGCTGVTTPVGDLFAVDYVAHEMGHQFAGNHTFNGTVSNCSTGNRNPGTSVEPGSGSSVMAYAGICGTDNLQPHSDPYWSMQSFDEITTYTSGAANNTSEVQMAVLTGFTTNGQQFVLRYAGQASAPIVRGTNFTTAGIKAAIEAISGWPSGGTVAISSLSDNAFTITFGGTLANTMTDVLELTDCSADCSGKVGELTVGGASTKQGTITAKSNVAPVVTAPAGYTIPLRTPFALTGSATDGDGDTLTYMWEQTDRGASGTGGGTGLISNTKANGPLFRQFGTIANVTSAGTVTYGSPGENMVTTNATRVFPDMAQILVNNTNALTGVCPTASATPTAEQIDCFSEYLPNATYVGTANVNASPLALHFRLTARDGNGGVGSAATTLALASGAGPFLVTSPNTAMSMVSEVPQMVTWNVAGTNAAPISTANVRITLSTDGGASFPYVLAASTANTGSASVALPPVVTSQARVKIEAVDNVYFDVSDADFSIRLYADVNGDGAVDCTDMSLVKGKLGKRTGQAGYDAAADINGDGVIDIRDLTIVSRHLASGTSCSN